MAQSVRVIVQFYDPKTRNYKYRKGFTVSAKLPTMGEAHRVMGQINDLVKKVEAENELARIDRRAADDSADSRDL